MSEEIEVGLAASGGEGIDKLIAKLDQLDKTLINFGQHSVSSLSGVAKMMETLQTTMVSGFTEMAAVAQRNGEARERAQVTSNEKILAQQVAFEAKQHASANKFHDKVLELEIAAENRRAAETERAYQSELASRADAYSRLAALQQKRDLEVYQSNAKMLADAQATADRQRMIQERRDTEMYQANAKRIAEAEKTAARLAAIEETGLNKQRLLDTNFYTASLAAQVAMAEKAAVFKNLGGNATTQFGAAAAGADLSALTQQMNALKGVESASRALTTAQADMNVVVRDAQGFFRGAAHEAGLYGLAHGQLIALLAGGALAAALHHIAVAGAEVEYNLQFLKTFSNEVKPIDMDRFIGISAGTLSSITHAAEGIRALSEAGLSQAEALSALPDLLRLSALGELSVAQAAEVAVESLRAFGLEVTDVAKVSDVLLAVSTKTNVSVKTLSTDLKTTATTFAEFGGTMKDAAVLTGALAEKGLSVAPLSTALTALIEPSKKQLAVLQQIGFTAKDTTGQIKPLLQIVSEFNTAVGKYSNQADIFAPLGGPRAAKAFQAVSDSRELLELTKAVDEAAGKTFDAYLSQIDTVEGSFKQLASTVQGDFIRAFQEANPIIREVETNLIKLAETKGVQDFLSGLAVVTARLTNLIVEHGEALKNLALAYLGLRVIATITTSLEAFAVRQAAATVATTELTVATGLQGTAMAALSVEAKAAALSSGVFGAGMITAAEGLGFAAVAARGLMAALGPITLAITAATVVYEIWNNTVSDGEKATLKAETRIDQLTEAYAKHTAELKKNNDELILNAKIKAGETTGPTVSGADSAAIRGVLASTAAVNAQAKELEKQASLNLSKGAELELETKLTSVYQVQRALREQLATFDAGSVAVEQARALNQEEQKRTDTLAQGVSLRKEIERLDGAAKQVKPAAAAEVTSRLKEIKDEAAATAGQVVVTDSLTAKVKDLEAFVKANQLEFIKPDQAANADALKAAIDRLREGLMETSKDAQTAEKDLQSAYKQGNISAISLYGQVRDVKVAALEATIQEAKQEEVLNQSKKNGLDAVVKAQKAQQAAAKGITEAQAEYERKLGEDIAKIDKEGTVARVEELKKRGQFADAYALENADKIKALDLQITDASALLRKAWESDDEKKIQSSARVLDAALTAKQRFTDATSQLVTAGSVKTSEKQFTDVFTQLQLKIDTLIKSSTASSGLPAIFNTALAAEKLYEEGIGAAIAKQKELQALATANPGNPEFQVAATAEAKKLEDEAAKMRGIWVTVGKDIEKSLTDAFGNAGKALGDLLNVSIAYSVKEKEINADLEKARGSTDFAQKQQLAAEQLASAQVHAYGDMAGAAKGFFEQGTSGFNKLATIERAYRAAELVMSAKAMFTKLFETTTVTAAKVTASTVEGAAAVATVPVVMGAEAAKSSAYGVTALAASLAAPFPANIAAYATVAAMLAAIGVAVSGSGGSDTTAADRQATQGTGTVLGDPKAKSESITKSLSILEKNSTTGLDLSTGMLNALRSIDNNISGLGSLLVRGGLTNTDVATGTSRAGATNLVGTAVGAVAGGALGGALLGGSVLSGAFGILGSAAGPIGMALGGLLGGVIGNLLTSVKTSLVDQGLTIKPQSLGATVAGGVQGSTFADVQTKKSFLGITYSNSTDRTSAALPAEISQQFTAVVASIRSGISEAATALGVGGDEFLKRLDNLAVSIPTISLKGLTGDQIQKQLESVFGALGDSLAQQAIPSLESFQKVGEGYLETLTRVAVDYQVVDAVMKLSGTTFKATGLASIGMRENLIELSGGLDKFTSQGQFFAKNFLSAGQQLDALREQVGTHLNLAAVSTTDQFAKLVQGLDLTDAAARQQYATLMEVAPAFKTLADAMEAATSARRSIEQDTLQVQGDTISLTASRREDEIAALQKTNPELVALKLNLYAVQDATALANSRHTLELSILDAQGQTLESTTIKRQDELDTLQKTNPALVDLQKTLYAVTDASSYAKNTLDLTVQALNAQGNSQEAVGLQRLAEISALMKTSPELVLMKMSLYAITDAAKEANIQHGLDIKLLTALGLSDAALALTRKDELAALDASHRATQQAIYDAEDKTSAEKLVSDAQKGLTDAYNAQLTEINKTETDLLSKLDTAHNDLASAYQSESATIQTTIDKFAGLSKSLRDFNASLLTGNLSTLSPEQQYRTLGSKFDQTYSMSLAGDPTATGELTGVAQQFLDASRAYNASSSGYTTDFDKVRASLENAAAAADTQSTIAQQSLALMKQQLAVAGYTDRSVLSVATAIDNLKAAQAAVDNFNATEQRKILNDQVAGLVNINASVVTVHDAILTLIDAQAKLNAVLARPAQPVSAAVAAAEQTVKDSRIPISPSDDPMTAAAKVLYMASTGGVSTSMYNQYLGAVGAQGDPNKVVGWNGDPEALRVKYHFAGGGIFTNGIVSQPTNFNIGQMGEGGSEAIVPLVRTPGGLGVRSVGGGDKEMLAALQRMVELSEAMANRGDPGAAAMVAAVGRLAAKVDELEKTLRVKLGQMS